MSFAFFLDDRSIEGAALGKPIELTEGPHFLLVNKDGKLFRRYELQVKRGEKEAAIALKESGPEALPPAVTEGWVDLFNGKDLTGWESAPGENHLEFSGQRF